MLGIGIQRVDARRVCDGYPVGYDLVVFAEDGVIGMPVSFEFFPVGSLRRNDFAADEFWLLIPRLSDTASNLLIAVFAPLGFHDATVELPVSGDQSTCYSARFHGAAAHDDGS